MKETEMYAAMKKHLEPKVMLQRIEMDHVPDVFYRTPDHDGWIENKVIRVHRPGKAIKIPFRQGQMNWIRRYRTLNGLVFVFLHIDNALFILRGDSIKEVYPTESELIRAACYYEHWGSINWEKVRGILNGWLNPRSQLRNPYT